MSRVAFRMKLVKGNEAEYKQRHDAILPELQQLLKASGISDYAIYLDEETGFLFGVLQVEDGAALDQLAGHEVMKKWWAYMKDIMETNPDDSPVSFSLKEVFYLP